MRSNRVLVAGAATALTLASGGCALLAVGAVAAAAAVGTSALIDAKLESTENATLEETYAASLDAIAALEFDLKKHHKDAFEGRILSERASGQTVTIGLFQEPDEQTRVAIRVGAMGDEEISNLILEEIQSRLPEKEIASGGESNGENSAMDSPEPAELAGAEDSNPEI